MTAFRPCVLIPTYDNPATLRGVVAQARRHLPDVIVVDDGSGPEARAVCEALAREGLCTLTRHPENRGKGAAVKTGFSLAKQLGFSHAVQVDGDGQHDLERIPDFVEAARAQPRALILGCPVYDDTLHRGRYAARLVTRFWNYIEVLGPTIGDSMCGFRVYPIDAAIAANTRGDRMNFDIEIPVRMVWNGVPVINRPVPVRYLTKEEGGISHYQTFWDTARISWTHTKLVCEGAWLLLTWPLRRLLSSPTGSRPSDGGSGR
jgi:glycosyltransferase involved in cell wall biosynthesis